MACAPLVGANLFWASNRPLGSYSVALMETAINRTMQTYAILKDLTFSQEQSLRAEVTTFLNSQPETDELRLTVAGLTFLKKLERASKA
jgi:hypothetical protein